MIAPQPITGNVPILELGDRFYDAVEPAEFPKAIPRFLNRRWAEPIGLGDSDGSGSSLPLSVSQPESSTGNTASSVTSHGVRGRREGEAGCTPPL